MAGYYKLILLVKLILYSIHFLNPYSKTLIINLLVFLKIILINLFANYQRSNEIIDIQFLYALISFKDIKDNIKF